jgi:transposase-like protein
MAKNYFPKESLKQKQVHPRKIVVDRILAFSKAYSKTKSSSIEILKN